MKISVIIPTYNEEDVISDCLMSLSKQSFKDFEVIVVDDGSTDLTLQKINNLPDPNFSLKVLRGKHEGAGSSRNLGAKSAKGEILVFVDSDMTFDKHFLKMLTKPILSMQAKGTFSKEEHVSNWHNVWSRCWNINEGWEPKMRHPKSYPDHQAVFRAILKSEFDRVGGFIPGGYDDDWSLSKKLGYEALVAPNAIFFHKNPESLKEIYNHAKWVGKRKYKFGIFGFLVGLVRSSFPTSLFIGLIKSLINLNIYFLPFKLVYDFGIFVGIINFIFTKEGRK